MIVLKKVFSYYTLLFFLLLPIHIFGQIQNAPQLTVGTVSDTTTRPSGNEIRLIQSEYGTFYLEKEQTINVVVGNVIFEHKGERLYADSARLNITNNTLHAYKNVKITQTDGTICYADYMFYNGNTEIVELNGNVQIISGDDILWSDKIIYNLKTNIGYYDVGGILQSGTTVISSKYAQYNGNTNDARFKGNVNVEDPDYLIVSSDMNYNTESKIVRFYGPSVIKSDSTILYTKNGYYDTYNEVAQFNNRSSIFTQNQYIEADTMDYDKKTSLGIGRGNVVLLDSLRKINIYGQFATLNELTGQALVTKDPFAVIYEDKDTTWVVADTFFTEPTKNLALYESIPQNMSAQDSIIYTLDILRRSMIEVDSTNNDSTELNFDLFLYDTLTDNSPIILPDIDSNFIDPIRGYIDTSAFTQTDNIDSTNTSPTPSDSLNVSVDTLKFDRQLLQEDISVDNISEINKTTENDDPRYLVAYRNVFIYNDSFQAKADSLRYSQEDTLLILYKNPVVWSQDQQVLGDIIEALIDSNEIRYVHIPKNGILIAQSTKKNEIMFDQIQANEIFAYFSSNEIDSVIGIGNAQTIYYATDEGNRYIGVSKAESKNLKMIFSPDSITTERKLKDIYYYTDHTQEMLPMKDAPIAELKLSRFRWRASEKFHSKYDFLQMINNRQYSSSLREEIMNDIQENKKK